MPGLRDGISRGVPVYVRTRKQCRIMARPEEDSIFSMRLSLPDAVRKARHECLERADSNSVKSWIFSPGALWLRLSH